MPARLPHDFKEPRFKPERIPFFYGVWAALVISAGAVALLLVLLTSP